MVESTSQIIADNNMKRRLLNDEQSVKLGFIFKTN
jgi:hypothetical protein